MPNHDPKSSDADDFQSKEVNLRKPLTPGYESAEGPNHFHQDGQLMVDFSESIDSKATYEKAARNHLQTSDIDLSSGFPLHLIWTTKDGRRIPIPHMEDSHLLNTIAFLRRHVDPVYKRKHIAHLLKGLAKLTFTFNMFDFDPWNEFEMDLKLAQAKEDIRDEGLKIFAMDPDDYLRTYSTQFPYLLQEAYRRKLLIESHGPYIDGPTLKKG